MTIKDYPYPPATTFGLSLYYRRLVITAWSTPGAALLATSLPGIGLFGVGAAFRGLVAGALASFIFNRRSE